MLLSYFANPARFEKLRRILQPVLGVLALGLIGFGLVDAVLLSPPDYQQSETVRIMYVHVPSAWIALFLYTVMGVSGFLMVVYRHLLAGLFLHAAAPVGLVATAICLITGSLWGAPMWGTWWVWDARLTSMLILFFQYAGILFLLDAFDRPEQGEVAASWLAMAGVINIPIIKFSVDWWATLHQPASFSSLSRLNDPAMGGDMLRPLLIMALGISCMAGWLVLLRLSTLMILRKKKGGTAHAPA